MPKFCAMGNPGAGAEPATDSRTETDEKFPIKFWYFEANSLKAAWDRGCHLGTANDCDGVYIFACNDDNTIKGQVRHPIKKEYDYEVYEVI